MRDFASKTRKKAKRSSPRKLGRNPRKEKDEKLRTLIGGIRNQIIP
jgi:hypothetical protein